MSRTRSLPGLLALVLTAGSAAAQAGPPLEIWGMAPGGTQKELEGQIASLGGVLSCKTSRAEPRLADCTASLSRTPAGGTWAVTASLVKGNTGIVLVTGTASAATFAELRRRWIDGLGRPNLRQRGGEESYQWVRGGRMLTLTGGRVDGDRRRVVLTVLEGAVLDALD